MRFAVFTHVLHHKKNGQFFAYAPYVREMNIWLQNFESVEFVAPLENKHTENEMAYEHDKLKFTRITAFNLLGFGQVL